MNQYRQPELSEGSVQISCDLRSDTVTKPCQQMRQAMADAPVGDDVYGEDPSVNRLEQELAERLGKEAGLLLPSGTQSNLCALMAHCGRGDEILVGDRYHVFIDEAAGASVLAGVALFPLKTNINGSLSSDVVRNGIKDDDPHCPVSQTLSLENTVHGHAIPVKDMLNVARTARDCGLSVHLDGARFFNAITELKCSPDELAEVADTVSVCLSKGLGTPLGSVLVGPKALIAKARRHRKILGGGMRQAGIIAAAGSFALQNNVERLADDHNRARYFADTLLEIGCGEVRADTNMVFLTPKISDHAALHAHLAKYGVRIGGQYPTLRMVFHKDISDAALENCIEGFRSFFN